jgi:hypothetical protein
MTPALQHLNNLRVNFIVLPADAKFAGLILWGSCG